MLRAASPVTLIAALCAAEVVGMAGFATFAALLPGFMEEWRLSNTDAGWINGIFFAGYLLSVPVLVALTDRVDARRVYFLCMGVSGFSSLAFALVAEGFWTALALRAVAGVGLAGTYMPGLKMLSDRLDGRMQGRGVAFYTASFGVGSALSLLLTGELAAAFDWHWAFAAAAAGPLLAMALIAGVPPAGAQRAAPPPTRLLDYRPVLRCRAAMAYILAYAFHNWELFAFRSWVVAFLVFADGGGSGWSPTVIAALLNLAGLPGSIIGNELAARFGRRRVLNAIMGASALSACFVGFAAALPMQVLLGLLVVYAVLVSADSASLTAGAVASAPAGYRGTTMGAHACIGFMGSFAGPLAMGVVLDVAGGGGSVFSWGMAFAFSGLVVAFGPLALLLLGRRS